MKKTGYRWKLGLAAAFAAMVLCSGTAFADGVILAPGVVLPSQQTMTMGPGAGSQAAQTPVDTAANNVQNTDNSTQAAGTSTVVISEGPGAGPGISSDNASPGTDAGSQNAAAAVTDTATLLAQSLADPWTILPTADPNIVISRGRTIDKTKPMIAITYDDGPQTAVGNRLMDLFGKYGQRATFYMVGDRVPSRAAEVQRMVAEGHEVANHTYNHKILSKCDANTIVNQVVQCQNIIEQTCGIRPKTMRLPGGGKNSTVLANVNMPIILWNIDTRDWDHRNAAKSEAAIIGKVKDGDIVLMHELYDATAAASESVVPQLVAQGFQLVTVHELAALKGVELQANKVYYSF